MGEAYPAVPCESWARGAPLTLDGQGRLTTARADDDALSAIFLAATAKETDAPKGAALLSGRLVGLTGITPGARYYLAAGGGWTAAAPDPSLYQVQHLAIGLSATTVIVDIDKPRPALRVVGDVWVGGGLGAVTGGGFDAHAAFTAAAAQAVFALPHSDVDTADHRHLVVLNGQLLERAVDYTLTPSALTLLTPAPAGARLRVFYARTAP
jgi:hypothetical protein